MDKTAFDAMQFNETVDRIIKNYPDTELKKVLEDVLKDMNDRGIIHSPIKANVQKILNRFKK